MAMKRLLIAIALLLLSASSAQAAIGDIICENTTTTGTGTVNLAGATSGGYLGFSTQIATGSSVPYHIITGSGASRKIETGTGTFTDSSPDTLTRVADWSTDGSGQE